MIIHGNALLLAHQMLSLMNDISLENVVIMNIPNFAAIVMLSSQAVAGSTLL